MKLETSFRMMATASLALVVGAFGCQTRTPIGEVPDAGNGNDAPFGDGVIVRGTGGATGTAGAGGGPADAGVQGTGGALAQGGGTGALGGNSGGHGAMGGMGGGSAVGGASGSATCQTYMKAAMGEGGHSGDPCYPPVTYSASGFYGDNILAAGCTTFKSSVEYELFATGAASFKPVQVTLTLLSPVDPFPEPYWSVLGEGEGDWRVKAWDPQTKQQLFQTRPLEDNETAITFSATGSARIDIYDCDLVTPSRSKIISWAP